MWCGLEMLNLLRFATFSRPLRCDGCCLHWLNPQTRLGSTVMLLLVVGWKGGPAVFPFPIFGMFFLVVVFDSLVPSFSSFGNAALLFAAHGCPTSVVVVLLVLPQLLLLLAIM